MMGGSLSRHFNSTSALPYNTYHRRKDRLVSSLTGLELTKQEYILFFLNGPNLASFCLFLVFSHDKYSTNTINEKSVDVVLGTRTRGSSVAGADESTELWQQPKNIFIFCMT